MAVREISLLVKIGDEEHSTPAWMNFMVLRLPSPYNGIIGRLGVRRIRAVPSTAHKMLKLPMIGGMVTLRSSRIIPLECTMVSGPGVPQPIINQVTEEKIQVAIHQEYPEQTIAIGSTLTFNATNNEAEYEALIAGLRIAEQMGVKNLQENVDSKLVANQVNGVYVAKEPGMIKYFEKRKSRKKSINEKEVLAVVEEEGSTWMTPIYEYLTEEILPEEKRKARAIRRKSSRYTVANGILYKKSFLGPWLRCVGPLQANYVLREIHEGSCSMHAGPRSVVAKALRSGYYWPTMHTDARSLIRECSSCQVYRPVPRNPHQKLTPITSP
ncbi:reverse transcriptase domain-containing protein [Tanacetum coccineum]